MLISFSWFVLFDSCPKHPGIGCKMCKFTWFFLSSLSSEYITKCEKRNSNFPPLRHLRDTQRSWSFTTRNLVSINQIVLRILLQISLFEPHSLNISCLSVFFSSSFFFLEPYSSLYHQQFQCWTPISITSAFYYSTSKKTSLSASRIQFFLWIVLEFDHFSLLSSANTQSIELIHPLFSRLVN